METEVHSGRFIDLDNPSLDDIDIDDISRHLSNLCRFNGGTCKFYSVAEHSVLVWSLARDARMSKEEQFAALMHDAHEAYLGDITTQFKQALGTNYRRICNQFDSLIAQKFHINEWLWDKESDVMVLDQMALAIEAHWLMRSQGKGPSWGRLPEVPPHVIQKYACEGYVPDDARALFMRVYNALISMRNSNTEREWTARAA